jgi:hypothetical protein
MHPPETDRQYPIGKFRSKDTYTAEESNAGIQAIRSLPDKIIPIVTGVEDTLLDTPYRDGGWTARQVLHHLADSHLNAYIRCKWALTEDNPVIKAYNEKAWAETPETVLAPALSVDLLKSLHRKWVALFESLSPADLKRSFVHPETNKHVSLEQVIALYAWHGEHHLAHLRLIFC